MATDRIDEKYCRSVTERVERLMRAWGEYHLGAIGGGPPCPISVNDAWALIAYIRHLENERP